MLSVCPYCEASILNTYGRLNYEQEIKYLVVPVKLKYKKEDKM